LIALLAAKSRQQLEKTVVEWHPEPGTQIPSNRGLMDTTLTGIVRMALATLLFFVVFFLLARLSALVSRFDGLGLDGKH
jgi:hypothetical protein